MGSADTTVRSTNASLMMERWPRRRSGRRKCCRSHLPMPPAVRANAISSAATGTSVSPTKYVSFTMVASGYGRLEQGDSRPTLVHMMPCPSKQDLDRQATASAYVRVQPVKGQRLRKSRASFAQQPSEIQRLVGYYFESLYCVAGATKF